MIQLIKDIINDTLKTKDKFTNKKIIPNNAFYLAVFMALVDMFTSYKINIEVFYSFLFISGYSVTLSAFSKGANKVIDNENNET